MITWHQDQKTQPLWHPTKYTVVYDSPNRPTCVERFERIEDALVAVNASEAAYMIRPILITTP